MRLSRGKLRNRSLQSTPALDSADQSPVAAGTTCIIWSKPSYGEECPAATWVGVQRLYLPEHVVAVELVAVFPKL